MKPYTGETLYRTNDGRIVIEGDSDAAFLVVADGGRVPDEYADLVTAYQAEQAKSKEPAENKQRTPRETK